MNLLTSPVLLFIPGNKPKRFEEALSSGANGIILELEDAVPAEEKNLARENVLHFLAKTRHLNLPVVVRINHITSDAGLADLLAFQQADIHLNAILYPKTESAEEVKMIHKVLRLEARKIQLFALIETAKGLTQLNNIVTQSPVAGIFFGAADFSVDIGCHLNWNGLLAARSQIVQAAALTQIPAVDSPYFDFADEQGLIAETIKVKELGFKGKLAIHPKQVAAIKQHFAPTKAQIDKAKEIISLFEQAGGKVCQYKGEMIDIPVYTHAQQILQLAENLG
ncbi:citrate lyase beta subunit [Legionella nautarum]|uniref:Citrate lyase beta subunit n=1 Tax=Legionella nautarum TaxID=45070 RepID=A0A0W0WMZ7_9GAMM|nr:CoA ester lyase [Legionella nautarum]KTD33688.1 citrate lyase beta subunit [Legionella nautarum]